MKFVLQILPWKRSLNLSIGILTLLIILSFYGLYTNKFYFFKFDNYIFPILTVVHFAFLYAMWFKVKEGEVGDPQMRNLEYTLYVVFFIYVFKAIETYIILMSYGEYEDHVMPGTFIPMGILIFGLQIFLLFITLVVFKHRKEIVGKYKFDDINEHIDSWE